jgi:putative oxidoreductase
MNLIRRINETRAPASVLLIRVMVGGVFLAEGIQKFLYPDDLGTGRFIKIGIPAPEVMGPLVGGVEILCGGLLIPGLLTRLAVVPLIISISTTIVSTKVPILLGRGRGGPWMPGLGANRRRNERHRFGITEAN